MKVYLELLLSLFLGLSCERTPAPQPGQHAHQFRKSIRRDVSSNYLLYLPKEYREEGPAWPLLFYLHGGRGRGDDPGKMRWYPVIAIAEQDSNLPFIVLSPQCPEGEMWTDTELLIALLDDICSRYNVDPRRIYLAGYSMGGNGVWYLAYKDPDRFAAIAPMSGYGITWWATRLAKTPIWAFHGAGDTLVSPDNTRRMVTAIRAKGGDAKLSIFPGRDHRPPSREEHYQLFEWFLEHSR